MTKMQKSPSPATWGRMCDYRFASDMHKSDAWVCLLSVLSCLQNNGCSSKQKNGCCNETGVSGSGS